MTEEQIERVIKIAVELEIISINPDAIIEQMQVNNVSRGKDDLIGWVALLVKLAEDNIHLNEWIFEDESAE